MKKTFIALISAGVMIGNTLPIYSHAEDNSIVYNFENDNSFNRTEGLIYYYSISLSKSGSNICLKAKTESESTMKYIGIREISIQRSSDNVNWTTVSTPADMLTQDASESNIDTSFSVSSGYYYRIVCAHYAKEYGVFGLWQIVPNISNSVWIS